MRAPVQIGLVVGGLLVVPIIGLAYSAISDLGPPTKEPAASATTATHDLPARTAPPKRTSSLNPVAAACCIAIEATEKTAIVEHKSALQQALEACKAASSPIEAREKARTVLSAGDVPVPKACENH